MTARAIIDTINHGTMRNAVSEYGEYTALTVVENIALAAIAERVKHKRILDLGIGGGRTVAALRAISTDYIGIDYVEEMVERCRRRFPDVRFETGDARAMPQFADASFDLIVFSCNGISMVDHAGRIAILNEVRRLLHPDGFFIFSTYNTNSPEHASLFAFPDFNKTINPAKFLVRAARFVVHTLHRIRNRFRYKKHEIRHGDYSIINDKCHHYSTMLYYTSFENQLRQLQAAGLNCLSAYDLMGNVASAESTDDSLMFVATVA